MLAKFLVVDTNVESRLVLATVVSVHVIESNPKSSDCIGSSKSENASMKNDTYRIVIPVKLTCYGSADVKHFASNMLDHTIVFQLLY